MKIEIDTNRDSKEDMKHAVRLLQEIIGRPQASDEGIPESGGDAFGSMFAPQPKKEEPKDDPNDDDAGIDVIAY